MITDKKKPLFLREYFILRPTVVINLAWIILASFLSIGVLFKKFEVVFKNESIWAISGLVLLFCLFGLNSWKYGDLFFGGVYVYFCFALHDKYNKLAEESKLLVINN